MDRVQTEVSTIPFVGTVLIHINEAKRTVVARKDRTVGVAKCHPDDTFDKQYGKTLAKLRLGKALIDDVIEKHLEVTK